MLQRQHRAEKHSFRAGRVPWAHLGAVEPKALPVHGVVPAGGKGQHKVVVNALPQSENGNIAGLACGSLSNAHCSYKGSPMPSGWPHRP